MRLFVAVDPDPEVKGRLRDALPAAARLAPSAKWVHVDALHLTLSFLGEVDAGRAQEIAGAIAAVAARHAPIDLSFSGAGTFGGRRPRVLWAGVGGAVEALAALQRDLVFALEALGFPREERSFSAHLTLARARGTGGDPALASAAAALGGQGFGLTRIHEVVLYESHLSSLGPRYTRLDTLPLVGSGDG